MDTINFDLTINLPMIVTVLTCLFASGRFAQKLLSKLDAVETIASEMTELRRDVDRVMERLAMERVERQRPHVPVRKT